MERAALEIELLAAGANGNRDRLRLGRRQNKHDIVRRLFEGFEKCVFGVRRQLVRFVNDENFVAHFHRAVADGFAHFLNVGDAAVAGGVHLDNVDTRPRRDRYTRGAFIAGFGRGPVGRQAVQGFGEKAGNRGFRRAARPGKQVAVGDAPRRKRVLQRAGNVSLPHHVAKRLRAILAVQGLVGHAVSACFSGFILTGSPPRGNAGDRPRLIVDETLPYKCVR